MGLFGFFKKQMLEVLEWKDSSKDILVYRHPMDKREELMNSSTLIVRESQMAVFVHKGQIADVFGPGTYKLNTENIPIITKLMSLPTGFNSRIKAEVYFINTKQFLGQKWGTQNPIMMRDADFGSIRLRGFGTFSYKVVDGKTFMREVFGTNPIYRVEDLSDQCKAIVVSNISDAIAQARIPALDLAANYKEIGNQIVSASQEEFAKMGLKLCKVTVENLSLPEEVEKALDERSKLGILGDQMGTYAQYQAATAIRDAAKNPNGGNMAGIGVGLGAGATMGNMFANAMSGVKNRGPRRECIKCGASIGPRVKYCPECGSTQTQKCPKCGEEVRKGTKFCSNCGAGLNAEKVCKNCGKKLRSNAKFCPECGEKV